MRARFSFLWEPAMRCKIDRVRFLWTLSGQQPGHIQLQFCPAWPRKNFPRRVWTARLPWEQLLRLPSVLCGFGTSQDWFYSPIDFTWKHSIAASRAFSLITEYSDISLLCEIVGSIVMETWIAPALNFPTTFVTTFAWTYLYIQNSKETCALAAASEGNLSWYFWFRDISWR